MKGNFQTERKMEKEYYMMKKEIKSMRGNLYQGKKMEKEKNSVKIIIYYLKVNIMMIIDIKAKNFIIMVN